MQVALVSPVSPSTAQTAGAPSRAEPAKGARSFCDYLQHSGSGAATREDGTQQDATRQEQASGTQQTIGISSEDPKADPKPLVPEVWQPSEETEESEQALLVISLEQGALVSAGPCVPVVPFAFAQLVELQAKLPGTPQSSALPDNPFRDLNAAGVGTAADDLGGHAVPSLPANPGEPPVPSLVVAPDPKVQDAKSLPLPATPAVAPLPSATVPLPASATIPAEPASLRALAPSPEDPPVQAPFPPAGAPSGASAPTPGKASSAFAPPDVPPAPRRANASEAPDVPPLSATRTGTAEASDAPRPAPHTRAVPSAKSGDAPSSAAPDTATKEAAAPARTMPGTDHQPLLADPSFQTVPETRTSAAGQPTAGNAAAHARHTPVSALPPSMGAELGAALARNPGGPVELTLSPPELGKLRMTMSQEGHGLQIVVQVERADTLDLLRRNAEILLQEIRQSGFSGATFDFSGWGSHQAGTSPSPSPHVAFETQPPVDDLAPAPSTGLDLRL